MKIYVDGSGFNGNESKYCVLLENQEPIIVRFNEDRTNNEMEYESLIHALKLANNKDHIITDSRLIVGQVTMNWKVNAKHLLKYVTEAKKLTKEKNISLYWIPREKNLAGHIFE